MNTENRVKFLRVALIVFGLVCLVGFYPLTIIWPAGWAWHHTGQCDVRMVHNRVVRIT